MVLRTLSIAALGGLLLGVGSRFPDVWLLSLLGFGPLAWVVLRTATAKRTWLALFVAGLCSYGLSFHALFWDTVPLTWLALPDAISIVLIAIIWTITTLSYALVFASVLLLGWYARSHTWRDALLFPALYVLIDWLGMWLFSIVNHGPHALPGPHFSMGSPAYQLAADPVLGQAASWGGVFALAFLQAGIGVGLYYLWSTRAERPYLGPAVALLLLMAWGGGSWWLATTPAAEDTAALRLALITRYDKPVLVPDNDLTMRKFQSMHTQVTEAPDDTDIILLPEDARFIHNWNILDSRNEAPPLPDTTLIDSTTVRESDETLYAKVTYRDDGRDLHSYKQFLMVFGEYMPYLYQGIGYALGQGTLVRELADTRGYGRREAPEPTTLHDVSSIALLCSAAMSPTLYADQARAGAEVFFNLASHAWFHESNTLYETAKRVGQVRAIESRRWYARSANDTPSFILDPYGRVTAETSWGDQSVLTGTVYAQNTTTPYLFLGQWVLLLPLGVVAWRVHYTLVSRRRKC